MILLYIYIVVLYFYKALIVKNSPKEMLILVILAPDPLKSYISLFCPQLEAISRKQILNKQRCILFLDFTVAFFVGFCTLQNRVIL